MKEKNTCSFSDRNSEINSYANDLYSPKKELFSSLCLSTRDCELKFYCDNVLITEYTSFTECSNCSYLVTKNGVDDAVFVLNSSFEIIDKINLNLPSTKYKQQIKGIAYDKDFSKLYIAHCDKIFSVNINGDFIKNEFLFPNVNHSANVCCQKVPNVSKSKYKIFTIGFCDNNIIVVYGYNNSVFAAKLTASGNLVNEKYIDDDIVPTNILCTCKYLGILAIRNHDFQYFYYFDKNKTTYSKYCSCCQIILNSECRVDIECPDIPCDLDGSLCEVVRSIALIEKAIAKLIICESEKIKSAIEMSECNKDLIEVNNSVSKTIMNLTLLEQMLKEKLEIAISIKGDIK